MWITFIREAKAAMPTQKPMASCCVVHATWRKLIHYQRQENQLNQSRQSNHSYRLSQSGPSNPSSPSRIPLNAAGEHTRIRFDLEQDDSGCPPADSEMMWAVLVGDEQYRLDNIPFFICGVSYCDVVTAYKGTDGLHRFKDLVRESGHSTLRIILHEKQSKKESLDDRVKVLRDRLKLLGCSSEKSHITGLISVDVPPEVSLASIRDFLDKGTKQDLWGYEEATIAHDG
jgi:hypothetical protein